MGLRRMLVRMLDAEGGTDGQVPVISGGKFVIGDAGAGATFPPGFVARVAAYGAVGDGVTDDTAAIQAAIDDVIAHGGGIVLFDAKTYLVNGTLVTTKNGNSILSIPGAIRTPIAFVGVTPVNQCDPRIDTGYTILKTTVTGLSHDATHGTPSLLGGPTSDAHWAETMVSVVNICFWLPANPTMAGVDLRFVRRILFDGCTIVAINTGDSDFTQPTSTYAFGLRTPDSQNFNAVLVRNGAASGMYAGLVGSVESLDLSYWSSKWCVIGWAPMTGGHGGTVARMSLEWCAYHVSGWTETTGVTSVATSHTSDTKAQLSVATLAIEDAPSGHWYSTTEHVHDPTNRFYGVAFFGRYDGTGPASSLTVNGATNLVLEPLLAVDFGGTTYSLTVKSDGASVDADTTSIDFLGADATTDGAGHVTVTVAEAISGEVLMQDGVTSPPVPIETEAGDDWLYED